MLSLEQALQLQCGTGGGGGGGRVLPLTCHAIALMYSTNMREVQQFQSRKLGTFFKPLREFIRGSDAAALWCCSPQSTSYAAGGSYGLLSRCLSFFLATDTPFPDIVGGKEPAVHPSRSNSSSCW